MILRAARWCKPGRRFFRNGCGGSRGRRNYEPNEIGVLLCSTNQRTLTPADFRRLIKDGLAHPAAWQLSEAAMPPDFTGPKYLKAWWVEKK